MEPATVGMRESKSVRLMPTRFVQQLGRENGGQPAFSSWTEKPAVEEAGEGPHRLERCR